MITVVNKVKTPNHIYCGRGSALGNPFMIGPSQTRDQVCSKYIDWFYENVDELNFLDLYTHSQDGSDYTAHLMTKQTEMLLDIFDQALKGDINLGCFCVPKCCHCETIKIFIENKLEETLK